jgi:predicted NBD/HSP70 family sugar kinase
VGPANVAYINKLNKISVLTLIRDRGPISRAQIARETGLSAPTVTRIAHDLIRKEGLVTDIGEGVSSGGRRPTLLQFGRESTYLIGVALGTNQIKAVLTNLAAEVLSATEIPTKVESGVDLVIGRTSSSISSVIDAAGVSTDHILGAGLAVTGLINRADQMVEFSPDFHWSRVDVAGTLEKTFGFHIRLDNLTRVMALGELWYGIGKRFKNFVCVNVGHNIGAGIIIDGKPLMGTDGMAGEFGHMTLETESETQCDCGNYGCLEALASGHGIATAARKAVQLQNKGLLKELCNGEYSQISIGGGVAQNGALFFDPIRQIVKERALEKLGKEVQILPATHGSQAAVKGAVSLILNEVLNLRHRKNRLAR